MTFPRVLVSVGTYGARNDVVFGGGLLSWEVAPSGSLKVYARRETPVVRDGKPTGEPPVVDVVVLGTFSPGSNWAVYGLGDDENTLAPMRPFATDTPA